MRPNESCTLNSAIQIFFVLQVMPHILHIVVVVQGIQQLGHLHRASGSVMGVVVEGTISTSAEMKV